MSEEKRSRDGGETMREGVRSLVGVLGALKDAFEQSLEDLREGVERKGERNPDAAAAPGEQARDDAGSEGGPTRAPKDPVEAARETVEAVRDRFDFATRKDVEALRAALDAVTARVRALEEAAGTAAATPPPPPPREPAPPTEEPETAPGPLEERPFRIHSE